MEGQYVSEDVHVIDTANRQITVKTAINQPIHQFIRHLLELHPPHLHYPIPADNHATTSTHRKCYKLEW